MSVFDIAIIAIYLIGITLFGCSFAFRRSGGGKDVEGFTTGSGRLPTWAVALSIFATHVSSIAFLGLPAKSFSTNWNPYVLSITVPVAAIIAAAWFVPFYRDSGRVSAYSFLEARYGTWSRLYASSCFLVMQSARSGVILFLMALLIKVLLGFPVVWVMLVTGAATTVYSLMGGISAVVWTDAIQSIVLIAGTILCIAVLGFAVPDVAGGMAAAFDAGKFSLGGFSVSDWSGETFWVIFAYAMFINLQNFGIDQSFTQRYVAAKSKPAAVKSLLSSSVLYLASTLCFVFIGTLLWIYVRANPGTVPGEVLAKPDAVFPWFIVHKLPVGASGLLVAAIIAAAMSTVSSTLNSGATVLLEDYWKRFAPRRANPRSNIAFLRAATAGLGVFAIAVGIGVMNVQSALTAFWALQSVLSGGMLGLFLLAIMCRRSRGLHAVVATLLGISVIAWVTFGQPLTGFSFRLHVNLAIVLGTVALVATGAALSAIVKGEQTK